MNRLAKHTIIVLLTWQSVENRKQINQSCQRLETAYKEKQKKVKKKNETQTTSRNKKVQVFKQ